MPMYAGIDIGGTSIKGMLADRSGNELCFKSIATPKTAGEIDTGIVRLIESLSESSPKPKGRVKTVCIGTPGPIHRDKGIILKAPNIPAFHNHPIAKNIEKRTGARVFLENDATVAMAGAWWKIVKNRFRNWIMITLGTGIGGGLVIDNKRYTGKSGNAMEIGHMTIDFNGKKCGCGNSGCWERYASGTALVEMARYRLKEGANSSIYSRSKTEGLTALLLYEEAKNGDQLSLDIFEEYAVYLGIGIANLANIFNPEAIVIGGGISKAHKLFLPTVKKVVKERALRGFKERLRIIPLKEPEKIPCLGAIKIALGP